MLKTYPQELGVEGQARYSWDSRVEEEGRCTAMRGRAAW